MPINNLYSKRSNNPSKDAYLKFDSTNFRIQKPTNIYKSNDLWHLENASENDRSRQPFSKLISMLNCVKS